MPLGHAGLVLSADVYRVIKRVLRREHQPTTRTITFSMVDGKWTRIAEKSAARDRRAKKDRRSKADRRREKPHAVPTIGRVEATPAVRKAARIARKKK